MWHLLSHLNIKKGIVTTKLLIPMCWARTAFLQSFKLQLHASWTTFTERMICSDQPYLMGSSLLELKILILSKVNTSDFGSIHTAEAPLGWHIYDVAKNGLTSRHKMQNYYKNWKFFGQNLFFCLFCCENCYSTFHFSAAVNLCRLQTAVLGCRLVNSANLVGRPRLWSFKTIS